MFIFAIELYLIIMAIKTKNICLFFVVFCINAATVFATNIRVKHAFQTTGAGNKCVALCRIDIDFDTEKDFHIESAEIELNRETAQNIEHLMICSTTTDEFYADNSPIIHGKKKAKQGANTLKWNLNGQFNSQRSLWIAADINPKAKEGTTISPYLKQIILIAGGQRQTIKPTPASDESDKISMKIFKQQAFLFIPTTQECRFYRIPAMVLDQHGNIIAASDRRYESNGDLGNHKIDVVIRRSNDNGKTWTPQLYIAVGDTSSASTYGYGDAAMVRTATGRIVCLLSAGKNNFFRGMHNIGLTYSDDDGKTWTAPRELTTSNFRDEPHQLTDSLGFWSIFPTSGKGLLLPNGRIMFAANCIDQPDTYTIDCYMLFSDDNGESWTIGKQCAFHGSDESKLCLTNEGQLLLSVRQDGKRGFNLSPDNGENWLTQWHTDDMQGNACNADILYYSRSTEGERDILLHSLINDKDRKNLSVFRSTDGGKSWHEFINVQPGGSAYSTMLKLANGDVALLFEDESYSAGNGYHLNFIVISKEQITL